MALIMTDEQQCALSVQFLTAAGNPATVDGVPVWASSDESVASLQNVAADGMSCTVVAVGPVGTAQVSVTADADLGTGVRQVTGLLDVDIRAAEATSASIQPGTPEPKP